MEDDTPRAELSGIEVQDSKAGPTPAKKKENQRKNQKRRAKERAGKEAAKSMAGEEEEEDGEENSSDSSSGLSTSTIQSEPLIGGNQDYSAKDRELVSDPEILKLLDDMMDEIMNLEWGIRAPTDHKVKGKQTEKVSGQTAKWNKYAEYRENDGDMVQRAMRRVVRGMRNREESIDSLSIDARNSAEMEELLELVLEAVEAELIIEKK